MGVKCCLTGDEISIGQPQQCVSSLCVRGHIISTKYLIYRWVLCLFTIAIGSFSIIFYQIPLFDTEYEPKHDFANAPDCCGLYWGFYISSWYLCTFSFYGLILLYLQCIVKFKYYNNKRDNVFIGKWKGVFEDMLFQMMRLFDLFSVSTASIYCFIYWIFINKENYFSSEYFKNLNIENGSNLNEVFTKIPTSFFLNILQNLVLPIIIFIDFFTNFLYFKYKDSLIVIISMICYFGLLYLQYLMGLTNEFGDDYIYEQINFNNNDNNQIFIRCVIFIVIIGSFSFLLSFIKKQLILRWIKRNSGLTMIVDDTESIDNGSDAGSPREIV